MFHFYINNWEVKYIAWIEYEGYEAWYIDIGDWRADILYEI